MAIVFSIIVVIQVVFRKKFFALTEMFENKENEKVGIFNLWNFLFYLSIGLGLSWL
jgi:hypothetical protein